MPNFKNDFNQAKTWATAHVVAAVAIAAAVAFVLGLWIG
jgi:hypothetical protein